MDLVSYPFNTPASHPFHSRPTHSSPSGSLSATWAHIENTKLVFVFYPARGGLLTLSGRELQPCKKNTSDLYSIHWIKGRKKGTTDHIREIQGIIDVHQGGTPTSTEVARVVMKNTQSLYDPCKHVYKLTWTTVKSHTHVEHV